MKTHLEAHGCPPVYFQKTGVIPYLQFNLQRLSADSFQRLNTDQPSVLDREFNVEETAQRIFTQMSEHPELYPDLELGQFYLKRGKQLLRTYQLSELNGSACKIKLSEVPPDAKQLILDCSFPESGKMTPLIRILLPMPPLDLESLEKEGMRMLDKARSLVSRAFENAEGIHYFLELARTAFSHAAQASLLGKRDLTDDEKALRDEIQNLAGNPEEKVISIGNSKEKEEMLFFSPSIWNLRSPKEMPEKIAGISMKVARTFFDYVQLFECDLTEMTLDELLMLKKLGVEWGIDDISDYLDEAVKQATLSYRVSRFGKMPGIEKIRQKGSEVVESFIDSILQPPTLLSKLP